MEIKEKIMKGKERTRRESIKPTMPAYVAAMKARRPSQSPNKIRRKVNALSKSVPVSSSPRSRKFQLQRNKRNSSIMLRRATMKKRRTAMSPLSSRRNKSHRRVSSVKKKPEN